MQILLTVGPPWAGTEHLIDGIADSANLTMTKRRPPDNTHSPPKFRIPPPSHEAHFPAT
jgi:hypothetical protein